MRQINHWFASVLQKLGNKILMKEPEILLGIYMKTCHLQCKIWKPFSLKIASVPGTLMFLILGQNEEERTQSAKY